MTTTDTNLTNLRFLSRWEHNWHDDSDFCAAAWDVEKRAIVHVFEGSTRFAGGTKLALAAPTEAELADATEFLRAWVTEAVAAHTEDDFLHPTTFERGSRVVAKRAFKSRKTGQTVAVGDEGEVVWVGVSDFGGNRSVRIGVRYGKDGDTVFHDANVVRRAARRDFSSVVEREVADRHWRIVVDSRLRLRFPI